ncbi:hypothetical protein [Parasitella parasitica]|uniref:Uncharacterized protein n=1 Tax=Parasitella parasitica TaxID=35722 RepID=A0A0B7NQF2_9FUNG|nr:hypothetical protein [Parasitella parasitica]
MSFFHEGGRRGIVDEFGKEESAFVVDPSFRLTNLTNLHKYIKNKKVVVEVQEPQDIDLQEAPKKKDGTLVYNNYTDEYRLRYFYFFHEKLLKPSEAAKIANFNYEIAQKMKNSLEQRFREQNIPFKKTDRTSNRPPSKLGERYNKEHLVSFFEENPTTAIIQDAVVDLTRSFQGLEIKESRLAEFMKEECNLIIKVDTRHSVARNSRDTLEARAKWLIREWLPKGIQLMENCVFPDETGFDINMRRLIAWSCRETQAIFESPSARGVSHTVFDAVVSAFGAVNVSMREPGNVKKRRVVGATKHKAPGDATSAILKVLQLVIICRLLKINWTSWMHLLT